jgi:hypothetical protein
VLHRVGADLVERHPRVVHLRVVDQVQNHTGLSLSGFRISDAGRAWPLGRRVRAGLGRRGDLPLYSLASTVVIN